MILRIMFLIHWAVMLWFCFLGIAILIELPERGFPHFSENIDLWAAFFGPLAVFYLIDYIINGMITWLPWDREK